MGVNVLPRLCIVPLHLCGNYGNCINSALKKRKEKVVCVGVCVCEGGRGGGGSHAKTPIKSIKVGDDN